MSLVNALDILFWEKSVGNFHRVEKKSAKSALSLKLDVYWAVFLNSYEKMYYVGCLLRGEGLEVELKSN